MSARTSYTGKERALRLFLQQSKGLKAWSDGARIIEHDDLHAMRSRAVDVLINLRAKSRHGIPADEQLKSRIFLAWKSYRAIDRMKLKAALGENRAPGFRTRLGSALHESRHGADPSSEVRLKILRRAIRKHFPDIASGLEPRARMSQKELDHWVAARNRKTMVSRSDMDIDGVLIPAGEEVKFGRDGYPQFIKEWLPRDVMGAWEARVIRASRKPGAELSDAGVDGPGF